MNVHEEISKKVNRTVNIIQTYRKLDEQREIAIERMLKEGKEKGKFSLKEVNRITVELNQFATTHHLPQRKIVTEELVQQLLNRN